MGFGKKLTALVLAAAMTAAACSCGTESGKSTAGEESSQAEEKPDFRTEMRDDMTTGDIVAEMGLGHQPGEHPGGVRRLDRQQRRREQL